MMYTDGLIERRNTHPDVGLIALRDALASAHTLPLERLIDQLIQMLTADSTTDDEWSSFALAISQPFPGASPPALKDVAPKPVCHFARTSH